MNAPVTNPVKMPLIVFMNTDNIFDFEIYNENGTRLDVTGYTADFEVDDSATTWATQKLKVDATVEVDPIDALATILRVRVTADLLQPGDWAEQKYPFSLKRTNDGFLKELTYGPFDVRRARI